MTNRMRLLRAANDLGKIMEDLAVSPAPYSSLQEARAMICEASRFALDMDERDDVRGGYEIGGFSTGTKRLSAVEL